MKKFFSYVFLTFLSLPAAQGPLKSAFAQFTKAVKSVQSNPYLKIQNKGDYANQLLTSEDDVTLPDAIRQEFAARKSGELTSEIFFGALCRVYPKIDVLTQQLSFENRSPINSSPTPSLSTSRKQIPPNLTTKKSSPIQKPRPHILLTPVMRSVSYPY